MKTPSTITLASLVLLTSGIKVAIKNNGYIAPELLDQVIDSLKEAKSLSIHFERENPSVSSKATRELALELLRAAILHASEGREKDSLEKELRNVEKH